MTEPSEATCVPTALSCDEYDRVQKKTFTKWVNTHLMKAGMKVDDLYEDFSEGSKLIALVELLTGDQLPKETGGMRIHRRQNVQAALECLERHQVKVVGITSDHIADSNQKLILGLVWTLIFHFQLSSDNDDRAYQWRAKTELLRWAQMAVEPYEIKVNDFASSWSDGTAFCAILHRHRPDMFDYTTQVDRAKPLANLQLAFNTAQTQLGVEKLLDPEDVCVANPDERSILTYVSLIRDQFPVMPTPPDLIDGESRAEAAQEKPAGEEGSDILAQNVYDLSSHLVLLRRYVSSQAWGKGRALLEALGLNGALIAKCYSMYHPNEEESVQSGLQEWIGRRTNITWKNLLKAMNVAGIAVQQCEELKKELYRGRTGGVHVTNGKERARTISTASSVGSDCSLGSLPIIPDIKAEYVEVKGMFVDICTAQGTPTLDEVKDHCLDLIECVFCNIPRTSHHEDDIAKARTMRELARVVCFRLSKWVSFDFFKKVVAHFQPTLRVVKERLTHYEDQLKPLLQQKLEYIAELQQREEVPRNISELAVKYKLDADGLLVQDLLEHRDFLAQRLGLPKHLLHVLSWGYGSVVIRYWVLRDVLPLAELALYREDARGRLTQHSVMEVCFAHHPSQEPNLVEQSPQTVHLQRRAIVTVLDAHRQDLDVTSLTSDLKDMGVLTADQCQKLVTLDDKEKRHDALLYTMLAHNKPDTYDKLVECTEFRDNSVAEDLQATYEDLLKSPGAFAVISTSSEVFSPMGDMSQPPAHIPGRGVPVVPELSLPRASITQYKEIPLLPVKPSKSCKSLEECRKVLQHDPGGGLYVGVAANSEGLLAMTDDVNKCVHLLTNEGTLVRSIGRGVLGGSLFGVAFDLKGNIWVTDWEHNRVVKLSQDGRLLTSSEKYSFSQPYGVGVCPEGQIYICDFGRNCVTVHDEEGKFLYKFGSEESGPGRFNRPHDITFGSDGLVYVTDAGNNRICVQSKEGIFKRDFKTKHAPNYIAATSDSHLLITSHSSNTIMVYGLQGELVHEFGGYGSDPGQFDYPAGICIDGTGLVFVADYWKRRIQVFY